MTQMTQTKAPGTPCYMPPETLTAKPKYTSKIDIYSYGVLIIHTLCGRWPFPEDAFRPDPQNPDAIIPASEVERRAEYLQEIGNDNPLMAVIHQCLSNVPAQRPEVPPHLIESTLSCLHSLNNSPTELRCNGLRHISRPSLLQTSQSSQKLTQNSLKLSL